MSIRSPAGCLNAAKGFQQEGGKFVHPTLASRNIYVFSTRPEQKARHNISSFKMNLLSKFLTTYKTNIPTYH